MPEDLQPDDPMMHRHDDESRAEQLPVSANILEAYYKHIDECIDSGNHEPISVHTAFEIVDNFVQSNPPITPLSPKEQARCKDLFASSLLDSVDRDVFKTFIDDIFYFVPADKVEPLREAILAEFTKLEIESASVESGKFKAMYRIVKPSDDRLFMNGLYVSNPTDLLKCTHGANILASSMIGKIAKFGSIQEYMKKSDDSEDRKRITFDSFSEISRNFSQMRSRFEKVLASLELTPMSAEEKKAMLRVPDQWDLPFNGLEVGGHIQGVERQLNSYLTNEFGAGNSVGLGDKFTEIVDRVRKNTRNGDVKILDIGGGNGTALRDAKRRDRNISTTLQALHIEAGMDNEMEDVIICPAEMLPESAFESYDLVISNIAFRYFSYPDIALLNAIKALSIGGEAYIEFGYDRSGTDWEELKSRLNYLYDIFLPRLVSEGFIEEIAYNEFGGLKLRKLKTIDKDLKLEWETISPQK